MTLDNFRRWVFGLHEQVPIAGGQRATYINFDNAATTPPLTPVIETMLRFLPWYSSVHRGHGYKSRLATLAYEQAHRDILDFFGANTEEYVAILGKNATEALNKASFRLVIPDGHYVLSTGMEHHSNDLPWRIRGPVRYAELTSQGILDLDSVENHLRSGKVFLFTVCGASNVTGLINPIETLARMAHKQGALLLVDAAQLAPHAPLKMRNSANGLDGPDLIAISGHKLYAPFGAGALIGPRSLFSTGFPEYIGGGTVLSVTPDDLTLADPPDRDEAGTPNLLGAVTLGSALKHLSAIGMERLFAYEESLVQYAYDQLLKIPNCQVYGPSPYQLPRVGVLSFNLEGIPHGLLAAALSHEAGIGVRHGCFCARPYVHHLLGLTAAEIALIRNDVTTRRFERLPGMVRISFGLYNTLHEVDLFISALQYLSKNADRLQRDYEIDPVTHEYCPKAQKKGAHPCGPLPY